MSDNTPTYTLEYILKNIQSLDIDEVKMIYHFIKHEQGLYTTADLSTAFRLITQRADELLKVKG